MLRNISSMRLRISAHGLSSRYSSRKISSAMAMRSKYQTSSGTSKYDRFSGTLNSIQQTTGTSVSLSDCRVKAAQSMVTLTKTCENFDAAMKKNLADEGIPESVRFKFDYDVSSGEAKITDISDEKYLDGVQSALKKSMKTISLDAVANGSKILNGKMTEVYYPVVAEALEKSFGQDISELSVDKNGNILGMNRKLRAAVTSEMSVGSFDARERYGFPAKELALTIKRVVSDKPANGNVSHMSFEGGSLKTADGDIAVGKKCPMPSLKNTSVVLRAAAAGNVNSMDLWIKNGDLF